MQKEKERNCLSIDHKNKAILERNITPAQFLTGNLITIKKK